MSSLKESFDDKKEEWSKDIAEAKENFKESVDTGVKKTKGFIKKLLIFSLIGLVVFGLGYYLYANYTYSEGSRTGYLIKMSKKGYVFKTWEGQMNLGGIQTGEDANIIGNIWNFSVLDEDVFNRLTDLEGKKLTLKYKQHNKALIWQGDTDYFVYDVEVK